MCFIHCYKPLKHIFHDLHHFSGLSSPDLRPLGMTETLGHSFRGRETSRGSGAGNPKKNGSSESKHIVIIVKVKLWTDNIGFNLLKTLWIQTYPNTL